MAWNARLDYRRVDVVDCRAFSGDPSMRSIYPIALALLLSACQTTSGPVDMVHKTGSTREQRQDAVDQCRIASINKIPQVIGTETVGGDYIPGTTNCYDTGFGVSCNTIGGGYTPPQSYSFDINEDLRERDVKRCLRRQGYEIYQRPLCTSDDFPYDVNAPQPPAEQISCVTSSLL